MIGIMVGVVLLVAEREEATVAAESSATAEGGRGERGAQVAGAEGGSDPKQALGESSAPPSGNAAGTASLDLDVPTGAHPIVWVRRGQTVEIRSRPGGGTVVKRADKRTEFSSPTVFGVVRRSGRWAGISTPALPNGTLGWVRLDPKRLAAGWTRLSIVVDLSERRAALHRVERTVRSFPVTIGMPGAETPTGRFAVTDTIRGGLSSAYGCCAVALSATQPKLPSGWLGGNRIAIHGTSGPLGVAGSSGCVRAADIEVSELIDRVPLGTPVFIRA